jgi:hypothetical protein
VIVPVALAGCGGSPSAASPTPSAPPSRFDEGRAWALIELQVAAGPRPAGSTQLRRLAVRLRARMPGARFERIPGQPGLRNVVARLPCRSARRRRGLAGATAIIDDHTPFLEAGVPAIDLIDWSYPGHSLQDGIDKLSVRAVDAVGETVLELVRRLERQ